MLSLESNHHHCLHHTFNVGVVVEIVKNIKDGINYFAETFMYQCLHNIPGYYDFHGVSDEEVSSNLLSLFQNIKLLKYFLR